MGRSGCGQKKRVMLIILLLIISKTFRGQCKELVLVRVLGIGRERRMEIESDDF